MARGDAKRKRENRALRAQAEKKHLDPAVLLDRGKKSSKKKSNPDNMPASLRRMLQLKAAAEGKPPPPRFQPQNKNDSNPEDVRNKPLIEIKGEEIADVPAEDSQQVQEQQPGLPKKKRGPDNALPLPTGPQKPSLKARKKNFLKKKKLRRKGKYVSATAGSDESEESDPELRLKRTAIATKPKFAEQASGPMQVNLKRKHWKEDGRTNSDRCNEIFARQMTHARKKQAAAGGSREQTQKVVKEADRVEVIEAYRMKKKGNTRGATLQSLADLVKKDHVSTIFYKYRRGDVVLFRSPTHPNETLIKRIIGLEGDWISIPKSSKIERIPKGHCWVEGDNNNDTTASEESFILSDDSRTQYGPIPLALLTGRALWICYPFSRWGVVESRLPKGRVLAMSSSNASSLSSRNSDDTWWKGR